MCSTNTNLLNLGYSGNSRMISLREYLLIINFRKAFTQITLMKESCDQKMTKMKNTTCNEILKIRQDYQQQDVQRSKKVMIVMFFSLNSIIKVITKSNCFAPCSNLVSHLMRFSTHQLIFTTISSSYNTH